MSDQNKSSNLPIVYILGEYPSRTETFIANEVSYMNKYWNIKIFAFNRGVLAGEIEGVDVVYCPHYLSLRLLKAHFRMVILNPRFYFVALTNSFARANSWHSIKVFIKSVYLYPFIKLLKIGHIHAHFATFPTDVAQKLAEMCNIPFSFSAHAHDIYTNNPTLAQKIDKAKFVITCTKYNQQFLQNITTSDNKEKIHLVYHGISLNDWTFNPTKIVQDKNSINILSIGRLVEKKGYHYLFNTVKELVRDGHVVKWTIVGDGILRVLLSGLMTEHNLSDNISFVGWKSQKEVLALYHSHTIFVQPSIIAKDGDRDGIPNVILEAMACGTPVIATNVSGISEILNANNGILLQPKDSEAIKYAILVLSTDMALRNILMQNARETACHLSINDQIEKLKNIFSKHINLS